MRHGLLCTLFCAVMIGGAGFAGEATLEQENAALKARVAKLEDELGDIKTMLKSQATAPADATVAAPCTDCPGTLESFFVDAKRETGLYGYARVDMAHDTSRMAGGNFVLYATPENGNDDDDEFNMTARQSRLGFQFKGPEDCVGATTSGKIEVDFYGSGRENTPEVRMRQAYLNLDWNNGWSLLGGQTWDIVSPLNTPTVNFGVNIDAGNIGFRRPQLRLTKVLDLGCTGDSKLKIEAGAVRPIGETTIGSFDPGDTGEDAGFPTLQGRVSLSTPLLVANKPFTLGVSGHWGEEEYDIDALDHHEDFDTWSLNLDLSLPVSEKVTLLAEVWKGSNMDAYFGGIQQGVNTTTMEEIDAWGGWVALCLGPYDKLKFNFGAGMDNPEDDDLNDGQRAKNTMIFGNVNYQINAATTFSFEVSHWDTEYKNSADGDSLRFQSALTYSF